MKGRLRESNGVYYTIAPTYHHIRQRSVYVFPWCRVVSLWTARRLGSSVWGLDFSPPSRDIGEGD